MNSALIGALALLPAFALAQVPSTFAYQGRLLDSEGRALTGTRELAFAVFPSADGGQPLWTESQTVGLTDGYYSVQLGRRIPVPALVWDRPDLWLELTVNGTALAPRQPVTSVPYAARAGSAAVATERSLTGSGRADAPLAVAFGSTGTAQTAARSDHTHASRDVYVVWGRKTCGADHFVHAGFVAAFGASQGAMGGAPMCLDEALELSSWNRWGSALVSRARSTNNASGNRSEYMSSGDLVCAVCRGSAYTLWGRTACDEGDSAIYVGHIGHFNYSAENGGHANAGPFCIDDAATGVSWTNWGGSSIIARGAGANGSSWSQYLEGRDAPCVVCR